MGMACPVYFFVFVFDFTRFYTISLDFTRFHSISVDFDPMYLFYRNVSLSTLMKQQHN